MIERDGGAKEMVDVIPLIQQLRLACRQDTRGGASGHSTGPSAPIAISAVDDYRAILDTVQAWHVHITGQNYGSVEQQLIAWATWAQSPAVIAQDPGREAECAAWCQQWVTRITSMLRPVRKGEIPGECPNCHQTEAWENVDGERTRIGHAIVTAAGVAKCLNCATVWAGRDLHALAAKLKAATEKAAAEKNKLDLQLQPA